MQQAKDRLVQIQGNLNSLVRSTTSQLKSRFSCITNECAGLIAACPIKFVDYFVKVWFRAFVGMKDECLVLINGQIIRPYHMKDHEKYIHSRGHEDSWYKGTKLSSCSIDGIDFEYRVFTDKYGHKLGIDKIADQNETLSSSLHDLAHTMDEETAVIISALKKRGVKNLKLHIRHKEESITGVLPKEDGGTASLSYTREVFEKCQRSVSLSTIVELPPGMSTKQSSGTTSATVSSTVPFKDVPSSQPFAMLNSSSAVGGSISSGVVARSKLSIYDSDDEKEKQETLAAAAALQLQREQEAQRQALNFGMDVSLDDIKRSLGASSELLTTGKQLEDSDNATAGLMDVAMDGVGGGAGGAGLSSATALGTERHELRSVPLEVEGMCPAQYKTLPLLVLSPLHTSDASVSNSSSSSIPLFVELTSFKSLTQGRAGSNSSSNSGGGGSSALIDCEEYFSVSEVLDEVCRKLRFTTLVEAKNRPLGSTAASMLPSSLWLPVHIAIDKKLHSRGEILKVPALEGKRYRVVCESNPRVVSLLDWLAEWMRATDDISARLRSNSSSGVGKAFDRRPSLVWQHLPLIRRMCQSLSTGKELSLSNNTSDEEPPLAEPDSEILVSLLQGVCHALAEVEDGSSSVIPRLNLRGCSTLTAHLNHFFQYSQEVTASSCGISLLDLKKCLEGLTRDAGEDRGLPLVSLDLSYNLFLSQCDHDWMSDDESETVWWVWCELLLTYSPSLRTVNLSHCVSSLNQACLLCRGLKSALCKRHQAGLPPLDSLLLGGMQQSFPSLVSEFRSSLVTSEGSLMGVVSIDFSGVTYSL